MQKVITIFGAAATFAIASPAVAGIVIYDSPGPVQPDENVLYQTNNQTGGTVTGTTNKTARKSFLHRRPIRCLQPQPKGRRGSLPATG